MFFVISPLSTRYPTLAHALDPNATLLRGLPTNAQLALQALRADPSIIERVAAAEEPAAQVEPGAKATNKQRFASLVKSVRLFAPGRADQSDDGPDRAISDVLQQRKLHVFEPSAPGRSLPV